METKIFTPEISQAIRNAKRMSGGLNNVVETTKRIAQELKGDIVQKSYSNIQPLLPGNAVQSSISAAFQDSRTAFMPSSQHEMDLRSRVLSAALQKLNSTAKAVLRGGHTTEDKQWLQSGDWCVSMKGEAANEHGVLIPLGGFYNMKTLQYGFDVIELLAVLKGCSYSTTMAVFIDHLNIDVSGAGQANEKPWYIQEKTPLVTSKIPERGVTTFSFGPPSHSSIYHSAAGAPIGLVNYWELYDGQQVSQHTTLWRHNKSPIVHWMDLFPQAPFVLYNAHLMARYPSAIVYFFNNEIVADQNTYMTLPVNIPSACPGGIYNLSNADLAPLAYRTVHIEANLQNVIQVLPDIIRSMKQALVHEVFLHFSECSSPVTGEDFMKRPAAYGYYQLAAQKDNNSPNPAITQPGQSVPGADVKRKMLIAPIIREGEIVWLYGKEKAGKSWLGILLAYLLSKGNLTAGKWSVGERQDVLYIDGEMLPDDFENNIKMVMRGLGDNSGEIPFYRQCAKALPGGQINLLEETGQTIADRFPDSIKLVVLDNFYCLTDNKVNDIKAMSGLFHMLSQKGIAVLVLDHTNTEGDLQGSISKRRAANLGIEIEDIGNDQLQISHSFARRLHGEDAQSYVVRKAFSDDSFHIDLVEATACANPLSEKIRQFALIKYYVENLELSYAEVAESSDISRSTAQHQYTKQIPKLGIKEQAQLDQEVARLALKDAGETFKND